MARKRTQASSAAPNPAEDRLNSPSPAALPGLTNSTVFALLPMFFFGALLFARATNPTTLVFDEVHYVPSSKALISLADNMNLEHPPLAKLILGASWKIFADTLHIISEPTVFRDIAAVFGLAALWAVRGWMAELGFSAAAAAAAVWLTGFNFLWFVQSKIAMLDIFFAAFGLWGALLTHQNRSARRFWVGWVFLGLAMACKWSAAPFVIVALLIGGRGFSSRVLGLGVAGATYVVACLPLAFLSRNAVMPWELITYTQAMLGGMNQIAGADHPYRSSWWQWILMARPAWYHFEQSAGGDRNIWAAGNPVLCWGTLPILPLVLWAAIKRPDRAARALAALYWIPILFWILVPRKMQLYYYYLPSSFMLGPLAVWAHERFYRGVLPLGPFGGARQARVEMRRTRGWLLLGFVLLCALTFLYFLPIMDARLLPPNGFQRYMWFDSWI